MRLQFLPYNPSKDSYDLDQTTDESPQQHAARVYHRKAKLLRKAARNSQPLATSSTVNPNSYTDAAGNKEGPNHGRGRGAPAKVGTLLPGPVTVLGAGRIDPFDAYCTSNHTLMVHEMLDHAISCQWTLFAPDDKPSSLVMAKQAVMDTAIRFPVCFHTLVYSGATHKAFHQAHTVNNTKSALLRLKSKGEALKALRMASQSNETALTDAVIFSMTLLTVLGYGEKVNSRMVTRYEKRTMAAQQDAQFYGSMEYEWNHWKALIEIVKMKGGLHTIGIPGLGFAIASFDIHTAIMFQTKPAFPLFMPSSLIVCSWPTSQPGSRASQRSPTLATGFDFLRDRGISEALDLSNVLHGVRDLTLAFDSFQAGDPEAPPIKMIIFARNLNQHELLTLPDLSEELCSKDLTYTSNPVPRALALYEICRLCTFVFQMTVLLPNLHSNKDVTIPYARRIRTCLETAVFKLRLQEDPACHDLLLWATLMTTWLAQGTELFGWFFDFLVDHISVSQLLWASDYTHNTSQWPLVQKIPAQFLWLESECEAPCAAIWKAAEALQVQRGDE
ncbi:hypothetical protein H2200_002003 [Cladophialophora chaetospira]|uniref:Uncharacterized protein n=1 Tax=Cladophialophora chaetospira TaxID=386627 RepID=A0AA39CPK8_9EURO|nr:hypothetical protein H2200_002003 [Cladophialophora chaetospira]